MEVEEATAEKKSEQTPKKEAAPAKETSQKTTTPEKIKQVQIPDIGGATDVDVIEVFVKPGDKVKKEESLITLEGEKATMEIPAPFAGTVKEVKVKVGDKVSQGDLILTMETTEAATPEVKKPEEKIEPEKVTPEKKEAAREEAATVGATQWGAQEVHAGPGVRQMARELGVDLTRVKGTGPKGRIVKDDITSFVKSELQKSKGMGAGLAIAPAPIIDFTKFGEIETKPLNKIKRFTGINVHRSWVTVPHVTQFDEADITEMEEFRQQQKAAAEAEGVKLTPLVFIMKAVIATLKEFPIFNSSLDATGENLIYKKYFHLGIAVDTPNGLVVPVIRNVDCKGMMELAKELAEISKKAREKGLTPAEMSGSCFTISSLGGIGGTAFTPIVNTPDVAILGVSKAAMKPVYKDNQFVPRLMLPLSLSYDHRVVDGADGARFIVYLAKRLSEIKTLLL
jgi:pyruvate dehydrogenase E2 component (dihydrolipoamide acetyltransferase)